MRRFLAVDAPAGGRAKRCLAAAGALAAAALGCGQVSADIFEIQRTGADRNANVTLLVNDSGTVTCNGGEPKPIDSERLLRARGLARALEKQAQLSLELDPEPDSTLRYRVRTGAGTVAFSDTSKGRPRTFNEVVALTADLTERVCGIER